MLLEFDNGQLPELYHIIYAAMYPGEVSLSEHDYAFKNSQNVPTKNMCGSFLLVKYGNSNRNSQTVHVRTNLTHVNRNERNCHKSS